MDPKYFLCPTYVEMTHEYISNYNIFSNGYSDKYPNYLFVPIPINYEIISNGVTKYVSKYLVTCFDRSKLTPLRGSGKIRGNSCEVLQYIIKTSNQRSLLYPDTYFNIYYNNGDYTIIYKEISQEKIKEIENEFRVNLNKEIQVSNVYIFERLFIKEPDSFGPQDATSSLFPGYIFNYRQDNSNFYLTVSKSR